MQKKKNEKNRLLLFENRDTKGGPAKVVWPENEGAWVTAMLGEQKTSLRKKK